MLLYVLKQKTKQIFNYQISGSQIYLATLAVYLVFAFLQNTTFEDYIGGHFYNIISYLAFGVLILKIVFYDHYHLTANFFIISGFLFSIIVWRNSGANLILVMIAFILAAKNVSFDDIVKTYFNVNFWLLVIVIACSLLGVINNLSFVAQGRGTRYALGVIYPTDFAARILYLMLADAYLNFGNLNTTRYLVYVLIALACKQVTDARLNFYCMLLLIIVSAIAKVAEQNYQLQQHDWTNSIVYTYWTFTPILSAIAIFGTYFYDPANNIYSKIDGMLSGRLTFGSMALQRYSVNLFGTKIKEHGYGNNMKLFHQGINSYFFIDSSYMRLLIIFGLVALVVFIGISMFISIKNTLYGYYALPTILLIVAFSSVVEQHFMELTYNPFLLAFISTILLNRENIREEAKHS